MKNFNKEDMHVVDAKMVHYFDKKHGKWIVTGTGEKVYTLSDLMNAFKAGYDACLDFDKPECVSEE